MGPFNALRCLRCVALRHAFCSALRCAALRCAALRCAALRCAALCCVALRCVALRFVALRCVALLHAFFGFCAALCMQMSKIFNNNSEPQVAMSRWACTRYCQCINYVLVRNNTSFYLIITIIIQL